MLQQIFDNMPNDSKNKIYIFLILDKASKVMAGGKRLENILLNVSPAPLATHPQNAHGPVMYSYLRDHSPSSAKFTLRLSLSPRPFPLPPPALALGRRPPRTPSSGSRCPLGPRSWRDPRPWCFARCWARRGCSPARLSRPTPRSSPTSKVTQGTLPWH